MAIVWIKFIICGILILLAGKQVAKNADIIAEKTGLGGLWIGLILVAVATSLPELFTGVGSIIFVDAPDLTVGNLFGANSYNLLNIGLLDILSRQGPILSGLSSGQLLTAVLSLIPVMLAALGIILTKSGGVSWSVGNIGVFTIAIAVSYCIATKIIYTFEKRSVKERLSRQARKIVNKYEDVPLGRAYGRYLMAACVIIASGIWLAYIGKDMSEVLGLGESFVGTLFAGFATTLPEITVSVAALLIGAREIAVANMLGSNLFNMTILFVDDILYAKAPIFGAVSLQHVEMALIVMAMTGVIIIAMATKSRRRFFNISWYVPVLVIIFLIGAYLNFAGSR